MKAHPAEGTRPQARRLRDLAKEVLGLVIQKSEHSPIDDARASLYLYHRHAKVRFCSTNVQVRGCTVSGHCHVELRCLV